MVVFMGNRVMCIIAVLFLILQPADVYAHSGMTDRNGGHRDHLTGEYHYHHGYPAHQHYDMDGDGDLDCPYLFDDRTGQNSGESSNIGETTRTVPTPEPTDRLIDRITNWRGIGVIAVIALGLLALVFVCGLFYVPVVFIVAAVRDRREKKRAIAAYTGRSIDDLAPIPPGVSVGEDGLPRDAVGSGWGKRFTFYISDTGNCFHRQCGCSGATKKINAWSVGNCRPCRVCKPELPNMGWYAKRRDILLACERYGIALKR